MCAGQQEQGVGPASEPKGLPPAGKKARRTRGPDQRESRLSRREQVTPAFLPLINTHIEGFRIFYSYAYTHDEHRLTYANKNSWLQLT